MIHYYVDLGQGFVFAQSASWFWAIIIGLLGGMGFFFKSLFRLFRRFFWVVVVLAASIIGAFMVSGAGGHKEKVVVLGIDGMDPEIAEKMMQEGKLPHFSALREKGGYARLATSIPAESVVAWTSFATGQDPSGHGIFDFVMRRPQDYSLYLTLNEVSYDSQGKPKIRTCRKSRPFWDILSENRVPCYIYFCPNTFPSERVYGRMFSGMGTPDVLGSMGKFSFYTSRPLQDGDADSRGQITRVKQDKGVIATELLGPKIKSGGSDRRAEVPLEIISGPSKDSVTVRFQGRAFSLAQGEWSDWQPVLFKTGFFSGVSAMARFYLKSVEPDFELYVTPFHFDPVKPPFPISYPPGFSRTMQKKLGYYATLGTPVETWSLNENRIEDKDFLRLLDDALDERTAFLKGELKTFKRGFFFFYFDTLDAAQHMFWRQKDTPGDPARGQIERYYQKMDEVLGWIMRNLDDGTTLIVLSDHGFGPFRRSVHLNRWLLENGYLFLEDGKKESQGFLEGIDWSRTRAYALGFGGIYLNLAGRERAGIVDRAGEAALKKELRERLLSWRDPLTGGEVAGGVYFADEIYQGLYRHEAPDLFVGFSPGYRASWQTALGGVPGAQGILVEDNLKKWSGDHLFDPQQVPGVIFSNRKMEREGQKIQDVAGKILRFFGLAFS